MTIINVEYEGRTQNIQLEGEMHGEGKRNTEI